jgi:hypothetical protein
VVAAYQRDDSLILRSFIQLVQRTRQMMVKAINVSTTGDNFGTSDYIIEIVCY